MRIADVYMKISVQHCLQLFYYYDIYLGSFSTVITQIEVCPNTRIVMAKYEI